MISGHAAKLLALRCVARRPAAQGKDVCFSLPTLFGFACARLQGGLTVESQEVVRFKTRAADRWSMVEATMRPVPVVIVKPGKKLVVALLGVLIQAGIGPFAKSGLDKPFGFTVSAWGVGTGEVMA